jgi:hypothetical protein
MVSTDRYMYVPLRMCRQGWFYVLFRRHLVIGIKLFNDIHTIYIYKKLADIINNRRVIVKPGFSTSTAVGLRFIILSIVAVGVPLYIFSSMPTQVTLTEMAYRC